jgi:hypothetical protein
MKIFNTKKGMQLLGMTMSTFFLLTSSVCADTSDAKRPFSEYLQECPWIGLIANQITYGPITISNVNIHDGDKLAFVAPGETLNGMLKYKVDAKDLTSLHLYHLVIGIKKEGAQDCITHNLGMWNSKGHGHFTLKAPEKPGIYEVRFMFTEGLTCARARDAWNSDAEKPSSAATIGIIIVE